VNDLKRLINDLKMSVKGRDLSRTDQLLLDILSEMTDILSSDFREKLPKSKRDTSIPQKEIRNEKVLSLQDFLRSRRGSNRRE